MQRLANRSLVGIFAAVITVPFLGSFVGLEITPGLRDQRSVPALPKLAPKRSVLSAVVRKSRSRSRVMNTTAPRTDCPERSAPSQFHDTPFVQVHNHARYTGIFERRRLN